MAADYAIAVRFGDKLLDYGFTSIPNVLLFNYTQLGISNQELVFILHLLSFWWGREKPYPSLGLIAERMGITWRQAHRYAHSLEEKQYLTITERADEFGRRSTSEYDFTPLLKALQGC
jgi:DNA replication protein DnaD